LIILYIANFTPRLQVDISCTFELISTAHRIKEEHAADSAERLRPGVIWANPLKRFGISTTVSVSPRKEIFLNVTNEGVANCCSLDAMTPSRWSTILRRITNEGPYINERMSILVLTIVVVAGISAVAFADKSVASFSLAPLYFLPLALSALVHPLRISLALSILCVVLHDLVGPKHDLGTRHLARDVNTLLGYVFVVAVVNQLGGQRRPLAEFAERQRDELRNWQTKLRWLRRCNRASCLGPFQGCRDLTSRRECT
jgi:hypothetical protein